MPKVTKLQNLGKKEVRQELNFLNEVKNQSFLEADTIVLVAIIRHAQSTQNNKSLQYFCNISKEKGGIKLIFCMQINKPFYKLILSIFLSMASLAQSILNNKFVKSLQYLEKEVRGKVGFCRDKFQSIQRVGMQPGMPKVLKITTMQYLCNVSRN